MINLDIKGYCQECPWFEPDYDMDYKFNRHNEIIGTIDDTVVTCKNKKGCEWAISHCFGGERG